MASIFVERDPARRAAKKFFAKIRLHLDDLDLKPPHRLCTTTSRLEGLSEEDKYGIIRPDHLKLCLAAFDKQPNRPARSDKFEAGTLAALLFSKTSFHSPDSTGYLIEDLKINDINRNSFLGGHSTFVTCQDSRLGHLNRLQRKMYLKKKVKEIVGEMDKRIDERRSIGPELEAQIKELLDLNQLNGDVLIMKGKLSMIERKYDDAIADFKLALSKDCANVELAKQNLSDALFRKGYLHFQKQQLEVASDCFNESISNNQANRTAHIHLELTQKRLSEKAPRRFGVPDTSRKEQRRR